MRHNSQLNTSSGMKHTYQTILVLACLAVSLTLTGKTEGQTAGGHAEVIRQVPGPLPKLALNGAVGETKAGIQYHRIVLMITNWDKFSSEMFFIPVGRKLPPNPCAEMKTRVVISVYSERGALLSGCIAMPKPADLGKFSFLIQKGKSVPDFVYAVVQDRYTGAAYRSNMVSPLGGATK